MMEIALTDSEWDALENADIKLPEPTGNTREDGLWHFVVSKDKAGKIWSEIGVAGVRRKASEKVS